MTTRPCLCRTNRATHTATSAVRTTAIRATATDATLVPHTGPKLGRPSFGEMLRRIGLMLLALAALGAPPRVAAAAIPQLCDAAAARAARETGVPLSILRAVALTETGRKLPGSDDPLSPWPWAINEAGSGRWYPTREEAEARAETLLSQGVGNFDVGCFQINWRWHGAEFASISEMFEPDRNALYAATLLQTLFERSGDWMRAVGDYHSATPDLAQAYLARFGPIHDRLAATSAQGASPDTGAMAYAPERAARANAFPLLRAGGRGQGGSLFPAVAAGRRLIGD